MKKYYLILIVVLIAILSQYAFASSLKIDANLLNGIQLNTPQGSADGNSLNIKKNGPFVISEIPASYVLLEIFSMYCPICQGEAPMVNKVYDMIKSNPNLKDKVRVIGIGIGNTPFEVDVFRKKFDVNFPLFPDDNFALQKACSEPIRTPTFVGIKIVDKKNIEIKEIHIGKIQDAQEFINTMITDKL